MADMRKVEEGNAVPEKRKLDLPDCINETFDQKAEAKVAESESGKRQKLGTSLDCETNIGRFVISGKMEAKKDGIEDSNADEGDHKDECLKVEAENAERGPRFSAAEKGKAVLIEESDEEEDYDDDEDDDDDYYYDDDTSSSDESDGDFSNGFDSGSEDIPF